MGPNVSASHKCLHKCSKKQMSVEITLLSKIIADSREMVKTLFSPRKLFLEHMELSIAMNKFIKIATESLTPFLCSYTLMTARDYNRTKSPCASSLVSGRTLIDDCGTNMS